MNLELAELLGQFGNELTDKKRERIHLFYENLCVENEKQNLTRLISPKDFVEGHLIDVFELLKMNCVTYPAMDLGSGAGIPGIIMAILDEQSWIINDSEFRKAEYLKNVIHKLQMDKQVQVFYGRGEDFLKKGSVGSITMRGVGNLLKVFTWIRNCSTWNNLVLFKGPAWDKEWTEFQESKYSKLLKVNAQHEYVVGEAQKHRKIIQLQNVPRGTL